MIFHLNRVLTPQMPTRTSHPTTRLWSTTLRVMGPWQAVWAPSPPRVQTAIRTTIISMTGDHASKNWLTCMTHVKDRRNSTHSDLITPCKPSRELSTSAWGGADGVWCFYKRSPEKLHTVSFSIRCFMDPWASSTSWCDGSLLRANMWEWFIVSSTNWR